LGHFGAWVARNAGEMPDLVATAGPLFFMDDKLDPARADQDRAKATTIARVLGKLRFAAFAPGENDWADGAPTLARLAGDAGAVALVPDPVAPPFATHTVRDVTERGGRRLRVGFVGYGESPGTPSPRPSPEEAVRAGVEQARAEGAQVIVALAAVGRGEAKRIADAVTELTAIVVGSSKAVGDANTESPPVERVGDVVVVQTANHLQAVAVLDLTVRDWEDQTHGILRFADGSGLDAEHAAPGAKAVTPKGNFSRVALQEIRESLGTDPAIDQAMLAYYKQVNERNRAELQSRLPAPAAPGQATYIGVDACSACHAGARQVWNATRHAQAYATLSSQFKQFNLDCVSCHVTGYDKPGGSSVTHVERLENVQCEVCHGPGSKHAQNPADRSLIVGAPSLSTCLSCHHPPHVERFDPAAKLSEILGPGHGMPSR
ncbi:MAG: hypothetical protein FWD17_18810, partial [Polyangiaceae bacterium]|nr:hypothetical protein [Polyangiaceae bacterium]